ncbi:hypothetical protein V8F06_012694 [Rhypophila decipiens]
MEKDVELYVLADYLAIEDACHELNSRLETLMDEGAISLSNTPSHQLDQVASEDLIARLSSCANLICALKPHHPRTTDDRKKANKNSGKGTKDDSKSQPGHDIRGALRDFVTKLLGVFTTHNKADQLRPLSDWCCFGIRDSCRSHTLQQHPVR